MQVSSNINNLVNNESRNVKFTDKETGKTISVDLDANTKNKLETSVPDFEHYLQTMYSHYKKEEWSIDKNEDGFLDTSEYINSKVFTVIDENNKLSLSSLKEIFKDEEVAIKIAEFYFENNQYFKDLGAKNSKVSISKDFAEFLKVDTNMDSHLSDNELFADLEESLETEKSFNLALKEYLLELGSLDKISLSLDNLSFKEFLLEQLKAWAEEKKQKVMNGIGGGAFNTSIELKEQNKTIDKLLKNNGALDSLTDDEKSIFLSKKDSKTKGNNIDIKELVEAKEKLSISKKYVDTQADNAKIFSLKI